MYLRISDRIPMATLIALNALSPYTHGSIGPPADPVGSHVEARGTRSGRFGRLSPCSLIMAKNIEN